MDLIYGKAGAARRRAAPSRDEQDQETSSFTAAERHRRDPARALLRSFFAEELAEHDPSLFKDLADAVYHDERSAFELSCPARGP